MEHRFIAERVAKQHALLKKKLVEAGKKVRNKLEEIIREQEKENFKQYHGRCWKCTHFFKA